MEVKHPTTAENQICGQARTPGQRNTGALNPLFPPCQVCGDRSNGTNFGVFICNGCRSFFRRTVRGNRKFKCKFVGNCEINMHRRVHCRACRYTKSLRVGMAPECVLKQYPGDEQSEPEGRSQNSPAHISSPLQSSQRKAYVEALLQMFKQAETELDLKFAPWFPKTDLRTSSGLEDIYESINIKLRYVVEWAKKLEVFQRLETESKIALLRMHCTEVINLDTVRLSMDPEAGPDHFVGANGIKIYGRRSDRRVTCTKIFNELVEPCRKMKILDREFWCLKALALFNPHTVGLSEKDRGNVGDFQQKVKMILEAILEADRARMFNVLMVLPVVCNIAENLRDNLCGYRRNNIGMVTYKLFDDLVVEGQGANSN